MQAGFARAKINPPIGTQMAGWVGRDLDHGCEAIHDDLYVRAVYLDDGGEQALIVGCDLVFFGRPTADRFRGALARRLGLATRQIMLNCSHTHAGPNAGAWGRGDIFPGDSLYVDEIEQGLLAAAVRARAAAREVTVAAGMTHTTLPMNRRRRDDQGKIQFAPNPGGTVCDLLPVCLMRDAATGRPVTLLFSVSCHPSNFSGWQVSADYPGVTTAALDRYLGAECSVFLQGTGADAKAGPTSDGTRWTNSPWEKVVRMGEGVAQEVIAQVEQGLEPVSPALRCAEVEMQWPVQTPLDRAGFQALLDNPATDDLHKMWARAEIARLDHGQALPHAVPVSLHGIQIGPGLRLVALEGEAVAEWGLMFRDHFSGTTFPLGYTNGAQLYLVTSHMLDEGGYEAESYYLFGQPAPLAKGMEAIVQAGLEQLDKAGIR